MSSWLTTAESCTISPSIAPACVSISAIELRVDSGADQASIAVVDHGPGMRPDVAARITERFYRADPARARHRGGSGLGMSIADAAVVAHGGSIAVDSTMGVGTTVTVTLPRAGRAHS